MCPCCRIATRRCVNDHRNTKQIAHFDLSSRMIAVFGLDTLQQRIISLVLDLITKRAKGEHHKALNLLALEVRSWLFLGSLVLKPDWRKAKSTTTSFERGKCAYFSMLCCSNRSDTFECESCVPIMGKRGKAVRTVFLTIPIQLIVKRGQR